MSKSCEFPNLFNKYIYLLNELSTRKENLVSCVHSSSYRGVMTHHGFTLLTKALMLYFDAAAAPLLPEQHP